MADWREGTVTADDGGTVRCRWLENWDADQAMRKYHDEEWGMPTRDPATVFESLSLGVFQAGLNWLTVFHKREALREAFLGFEPVAVASLTPADAARLVENPQIIRNRAKIEATIHNAQIAVNSERPLAEIAWDFAPATHLTPASGREVAVASAESIALSAELKSAGYKFVGPTSVYALMQAIGIVNDHISGCFRASRSDEK